MNVCQINVSCFVQKECRFDKIEDIFQGFGSLVSLRLQKDGGGESKQIWTSLLHCNTGGLSSRCKELNVFSPLCKRPARKMWHSYRCQCASIRG